MTREEYVARMNSEDDWAPDWDAVEEEFNRLYPGREPSHYGTEIHARAIFGGDNYLDGYSIYDSGKGYQHIRYTYTTERFFEAGTCVPGNGTPLHIGTDSLITALIAVNDTSAQTLDTVHGKVEFIQFVGITETELNKIREDFDNLPILIENMKKENPELITDMKRKKSYL